MSVVLRIWLKGFRQGCQDQSMKEWTPFQQMVLEIVDLYMEIGLLH